MLGRLLYAFGDMTITRLTFRISGGTLAMSKSHIKIKPREGVKFIMLRSRRC